MVLLEGKCPKCGLRRYGWALKTQPPKTCPNCGEVLEIKDIDDTISESQTPFFTDKSFFKSNDSS
jgi:uncharacterized protein (DUF983 family)